MTMMWGESAEEKLRAIAADFLAGCRYARDEAGRLVMIAIYLDPYTDNEMERRLSTMLKKMCEEEGFPVCSSLKEAIRVVSYMCRYATMKDNRR
jgi:hypothetical protein